LVLLSSSNLRLTLIYTTHSIHNMAPVTANSVVKLLKRETCGYDSFNNYRCYNTGWSNWGRWIVVGVIILIFLLFVSCACITSRRRRSRGNAPIRGTGWMSTGPLAPPPYQPPPQYSNQAPQNEGAYAPPTQPKPTYGGQQNYPEPQQNYGGGQPNYGGGHQNYGGGQENYEMGYQAPSGPPPKHYK